MARHVWTVLCAQAITDTETKNISLINSLEQVTIIKPIVAEGETVSPPPIELRLVSYWLRSEINTSESSEARIRFYKPDGKKGATYSFKVDLGPYPRLRAIAVIQFDAGMPEGRYEFVTQLQTTTKSGSSRWVTVSRTPFDVNVIEPEPNPTQH